MVSKIIQKKFHFEYKKGFLKMRMLQRNGLLTLLLTLSLALTSCSSGSKKSNGNNSALSDAAENFSLELNGSSDDNTAGPLQTIYFDFDSSSLTAAARATLEENANWLKVTDKVDIQIEGHCDERGGHQYNLALGERRARSVKDYLVALGVDASRVSVISYGKEKSVAFGHDEGAWSKNRRANFVVTAK
jgi:peptidoglycan-associated lipoprotein